MSCHTPASKDLLDRETVEKRRRFGFTPKTQTHNVGCSLHRFRSFVFTLMKTFRRVEYSVYPRRGWHQTRGRRDRRRSVRFSAGDPHSDPLFYQWKGTLSLTPLGGNP